MIKMKGLTHFTIPVKDLKRSKEFYCETLGFDFVRENPHMVFCKCENDFFVLTHSENPVDPNPGDSHDIHTAFYVDSDEYDRAKVKTMTVDGLEDCNWLQPRAWLACRQRTGKEQGIFENAGPWRTAYAPDFRGIPGICTKEQTAEQGISTTENRELPD